MFICVHLWLHFMRFMQTKILARLRMIFGLIIASRPHTAEVGNRRCTPMSGAEHRRAAAFIGGFKQLRLFHFSFINQPGLSDEI